MGRPIRTLQGVADGELAAARDQAAHARVLAYVYRVQIDGDDCTTHSDETPAEFLQSLAKRFGENRSIVITEWWSYNQ